MAIVWGDKVELARAGKSSVGFRIGYEASFSGKTTTVKIYVNTKYAVYDVVNTLKVSVTGATDYEDAVGISTSNNSGSGWADANTKLLKTFNTTSTGTISISASLTGVELDENYSGGKNLIATVSGSVKNYTNGTTPTISITDNETNTFTISGSLGKNGDNNVIKSATIYYTTNGTTPSTTNGTAITISGVKEGMAFSYTRNAPVPAGEAAKTTSYTVKAIVYCNFANNTTTATANSGKGVTVKCRYGANPSKPTISYSKSKLTLKENISFTWKDGTATTDTLPMTCLHGYRIRLCSTTAENIKLAGNSISSRTYSTRKNITTEKTTSAGDDNWYNTHNAANYPLVDGASFVRNGTTKTNTFTFDPAKFDFSVGDYVFLIIGAYYKYTKADGTAGYVWNDNKAAKAIVSDLSEFQNAGIVHVKVGEHWKEGQVWVKVGDQWKEAETVQTKVGDTWRESQ